MIEVWTDGAYSIQKQRGGYAFLIRDEDGDEVRRCVQIRYSSSQRAELVAIREAIRIIPGHEVVLIHTDSQYAVGGFSGKWKLKANTDIWHTLMELAKGRDITLEHIPRCSTPEHVAVDAAAKQAMYVGGGNF